jgi:predicted transcriptional regulator of viral defense system
MLPHWKAADKDGSTKMERNNLDQLLHSMGRDGEIERINRGRYKLS